MTMTPPNPSLMRPGAPPVVLASASDARRRLLSAAGVTFRTSVPAVDEATLKAALQGERAPPAEAAVAIAELKARRAASAEPPEALVIGADQLLTVGDTWLDKPATLEQAKEQLACLSGRRHELWSAAVIVQDGGRIWHHVGEARLWMRDLSAGFIEHYLGAAGTAVLGSVGAYQLETLGAQALARVEGDHFVVQGLPLLPLLEFLRVRGVLQR